MIGPYPFPDEHSPAGSGHYYAIRFAPRPLRHDLSLVTAFFLSLQRIPRQCSDPGIAQEKLRWWQGELARAWEGNATHPITHRLPALLDGLGVTDAYLAPLFSGIEDEISCSDLLDGDALEARFRQITGCYTVLLTLVCGGTEAQLHTARELGSFIHQVEVMRDLGRDLRRQRCFIPREQLQKFRLAPSDLYRLKVLPGLDSLLKEIADTQRRRYEQILKVLPGPTRTLGPVLRMAAISAVMLDELHREGADLLLQRTSLTPLRKLWVAWRWRT